MKHPEDLEAGDKFYYYVVQAGPKTRSNLSPDVLRRYSKLNIALGTQEAAKMYGITTVLTYFGKQFSIFGAHGEDALLHSLNLCIKGRKQWTIFHEKHAESLAREICGMCLFNILQFL